MPSTNIFSLPPEVLRHTACYLPLPEIHSLILSNPRYFHRLHSDTTHSPSFAPWRRLFFAYQRVYILTLRETQDRAVGMRYQDRGNIVASGQVQVRTALEQELEELNQDMVREFGFLPACVGRMRVDHRVMLSIPGGGEGSGSNPSALPPILLPRIRLDMIFDALEHLSGTGKRHLRLPPLLCPLSEVSKILNKSYLQLELIQKFTPVPLLLQFSSPQGSVAETVAAYRIFTAYLLFTSLTPNDILGVLSEALFASGKDTYQIKAARGEQEMALVEYFHFLRLFLAMYEYDEVLQLKDVRGDDTLSPQGRRILVGRLDAWIRGYFRPERPLPPPPPPAPALENNIVQNPSSILRRFERTASTGNGVTPSGSRQGTLSRRTSSWSTSRSSYSNSSPISNPPVGGQQNFPSPNLTKEQRQIVGTDVRPGDLMKVRAYAGTGKTMSLTEYAKARPRIRFLYIAFNKSAQQDAEKRFPHQNVDCKTMHSVAYQVLHMVSPRIKDSLPDFGKTMHDRRSWDGEMPKMEICPFSAVNVIEMLGLRNNVKITSALVDPTAHSPPGTRITRDGVKPFPTANSVATVIKRTLEKYWSSRDLELNRKCVPWAMVEKLGLKGEVLLKWTDELWKEMVAAKVRYFSHDGYLKLLHLNGIQAELEGTGVGGARISGVNGMDGIEREPVRGDGDRVAFSRYDVIMFDEAQDSNPCMAEIILRQRPWAGLIVVGDPYQKIYGFRGATNECFDDIAHVPTYSFYLTHSFRFGDGIAGVANVLLRALRERVGVNGVRKEDSVKRSLPQSMEMGLARSGEILQLLRPGEIGKGGSGKYTVVFRKNITLVEYAIEYCISHVHLRHRIALNTARGFSKSTLFTLLRTAYTLFHKGIPSKTGILAGYNSWQELKNHVEAENSEDGSGGTDSPGLDLVVGLERLIANEGFLRTIAICEQMVADKGAEADADVILITTHQAKGQEWDRVIVADDFNPPYHHRGSLGKTKHWREEMFMMYVAVTRAKKELIVGEGVAAWLAGEMGTYRFYISPVQGEGKCPVCSDRPRIVLREDGEVGKAHLRRVGVIMGYECLLPIGSFGVKITEPAMRSRRPFCGKKDVLVCDLCVQQWSREDRIGTDTELLAITLPLTTISDTAENTAATLGAQNGVDIVLLAQRTPLSSIYLPASTAENRMVEKWVESRSTLSIVAARREERGNEVDLRRQ